MELPDDVAVGRELFAWQSSLAGTQGWDLAPDQRKHYILICWDSCPFKRGAVPRRRRTTVALQQYQRVWVRRLLQLPDAYDAWRVNQRPPRIGDIGTIVEILQAPGLADHYTVESSGADGVTIWLGDFLAEELEPLPEPVQYPVPVWLAEQNLASWRDMVAFFESFVAGPHGILVAPLLRLVSMLLASEIAQAFRAGQSVLRLMISTAEHHGLKPGEPFISVSATEDGQRLLLEYWDTTGGRTLDSRLCAVDGAMSELDAMLKRLWTNTRGRRTPSK